MSRLNVLLIRPLLEQDELVTSLELAGIQIYRYPVMKIEPVLAPHAKSKILDFDHYQIAIFVSRTAVRLGVDWLENYWPMLPVGVRYYAVGKATATELAERGICAESPQTTFNSEALLALDSLRSVAGQKALIFAGKGGRTLLAEELQKRGATVDRCELYRRCIMKDSAGKIARLLTDKSWIWWLPIVESWFIICLSLCRVSGLQPLRETCRLIGFSLPHRRRQRTWSRLSLSGTVIKSRSVLHVCRG